LKESEDRIIEKLSSKITSGNSAICEQIKKASKFIISSLKNIKSNDQNNSKEFGNWPIESLKSQLVSGNSEIKE
jgi:hypothetical protein